MFRTPVKDLWWTFSGKLKGINYFLKELPQNDTIKGIACNEKYVRYNLESEGIRQNQKNNQDTKPLW